MITMYQLTVPPLKKALRTMDYYLDRAADFVGTGVIGESQLLDSRLAVDMLPLAAQVQRLSDNAKFGVARLAGIEAPAYPDREASFAELKVRLDNTIDFIEDVGEAQFSGAEDRPVTLAFRSISGTMTGYVYLSEYLLPNIYFHLATAHGILRQNGLQIGKRDYFGAFVSV